MNHTIYLNCKAVLLDTAKESKRLNPTDKPMIAFDINNQLDQMVRQIDWHCMKDKFSEAMANVYKGWLENYACTLHP